MLEFLLSVKGIKLRGELIICKRVKRFGDMNCDEASSKELLGYTKYNYKKIDKVASSIKEL